MVICLLIHKGYLVRQKLRICDTTYLYLNNGKIYLTRKYKNPKKIITYAVYLMNVVATIV